MTDHWLPISPSCFTSRYSGTSPGSKSIITIRKVMMIFLNIRPG